MKNHHRYSSLNGIITGLLCLTSVVLQTAGQERNLLTGTYSEEDIRQMIIPLDQWQPFPGIRDRTIWSEVEDHLTASYISKGEELLDFKWPNLPASVFLEFAVNGNRSHYQGLYFERRNNLSSLVMAEMLEGKGRFLDNIVNGIWAICEETFWGVPAHLYLQQAGHGLPDISEPTVDLFAAETGALLAWIVYLLEEELDLVSPLVCDRIRLEAQRRILTPCLERDDFWWQGLVPLEKTGVNLERLNNWSPWIDSNWLTAVLLLEDDQERRQQAIYKIMGCLDRYLNPHPDDGGCDEGPSYWGHAGGRVYHSLELLYSASGGLINIFGEPLIREMGKYIYRAHIDSNYYINFADAGAKIHIDPSLVYRYGKSTGDEIMAGFGAYAANLQGYGNQVIGGSLGKQLFGLFHLKDLQAAESAVPFLMDVWLPDIQVMAARSDKDSEKEFYLAAKGGHNHESHNHNDVGNFIVYLQGQPVIIDIGVETYSKKTFRPETRYEIWTMQSGYHSLPTINGTMQKAGIAYRAKEVSHVAGKNNSTLTLDIAGAYPPEAMIASYVRSMRLNCGKSVVITDTYAMTGFRKHLSMNLMTPLEVEVDPEGRVRLSEQAGKTQDVFIYFDAEKFEVHAEPMQIKDQKLQSSWGRKLTRIVMEARDEKLKDQFKLIIK